MEFLKSLLKQVPLSKNISSVAISLVALAVTYILNRLGVTEADAVTMALIAPLVNWIREAMKDKPARVLSAYVPATLEDRLAETKAVSDATDREMRELDRVAREAASPAEQIVDTLRDGLEQLNTPKAE